MKSENDVFDLYQNTFMPIYGDLVVVSGKKPPELLEQLESCMAHFAVARTTQDPALIQENIAAAYRHIVRASLDAAKLLWTTLHTNVETFVMNEEIRRFCANASEGQIHTQYQKAQNASINARQTEISNVGIDPEKSIQDWYNAALEYKNLLELIDLDKVRQFKKYRLLVNYKTHLLGFVLGVLASTLVSWFWPQYPNRAIANDAQAAGKPYSVEAPGQR
ncbi:hypothetical protein ACH5Y9_22180 [Methylomonas sp. BW4-1]|uniref:hypothetical protein n=1 Tax=Methylomonas sp. BW4-1 TaxID=3376685 RepID=UPI004041B276